MIPLVRRIQPTALLLQRATSQFRLARTDARKAAFARKKALADEKSEWWAVDGEMHEIGENVPLRERFVIPRDNIPNRRRKQLREQFMRRTRLLLKDTEQESWCKNYMGLYQELRENWERIYWDEGYSKKLGQDHSRYDSAEDDNLDFSPYRHRQPDGERAKNQGFVRNTGDDAWEKVSQIRDRFESDREKRMREKAFAPMNKSNDSDSDDSTSINQPYNTQRYF
ncbi:uncharacterized protein LOC124931486 [Impatiens glandulifera]|uniref:uncharacterized protein LOC124931486 n=1 Tax=Impatiens glandulifera TaxID=253017 RepID=UPI001FB05B6E|nr:uncharacterized protein LOC124931486 [Impatiens glandulifera]